jgi:hypothetical protein
MNFTSKKQSKTLVGLGLEPGTCDLFYEENTERPVFCENGLPADATPCWSGERLIELLPMKIDVNGKKWRFSMSTQNEDGMYVMTYSSGGNTFSKNNKSLFLAAYDMMHDVLLYF